MFGLGFSEIILIGFALIILIRPEDFPKVVKSTAKLYGKLRQMYYSLVNEFHALAPNEDTFNVKPPKNRVKR
jgi:Sec-independent protein translocase protein TatA